MRGFISGIIWGTGVTVLGLCVLSELNPLPAPTPAVASETPSAQTSLPEDSEPPVIEVGRDEPTVKVTPPVAPKDVPAAEDKVAIDDEPITAPSVEDAPQVFEEVAEPISKGAQPTKSVVDAEASMAQPSELTDPEADMDRPETGPSETARQPDVKADAPDLVLSEQAVPEESSAIALDEPVELPDRTDLPTSEEGAETLPATSSSSTPPELTSDEVLVPSAPSVTREAPAVATVLDATPDRSAALSEPLKPNEDQFPDETDTSSSTLRTSPDPVASNSNTLNNKDKDQNIRDRTLPVIEAPTVEAEATPVTEPREVDEQSQSAALSPTIGEPVVPLTERYSDSNLVDRGGQDDAAATASGRPLDLYAAQYDNPDDKPLMSIVLIDDAGSVGVEALRDFPYPLTFAIDPTSPRAVEKMLQHRAAGFEVVAMVDLPKVATARDAEVTLSASFERLDQTVALLEGTQDGIQGNRPLSNQVKDFIATTGRGLITQGNGLNTVQKLALRDGVPALPVFRDFDGAGQTPTVMRRFLDQAAFRARQEGGVIMLGRVRPNTISALLIWGLQDRASRVALAPVSTVLKAAVETAE